MVSPTSDDTACPGGDDLESIGCLYEVASSTYWDRKRKLDGLGAFSHERWGSMECLHFILPNMTSHGQGATPKQVNLPHYQTSFEHIKAQVASFRESGGVIKFQVYKPDRNYSNDFLHVTNVGLPSIAMLDWDSLARKANTSKKGDKKRQHKYRDFGTTSGQCTTRVGSEIGIGKPRKNPVRMTRVSLRRCWPSRSIRELPNSNGSQKELDLLTVMSPTTPGMNLQHGSTKIASSLQYKLA